MASKQLKRNTSLLLKPKRTDKTQRPSRPSNPATFGKFHIQNVVSTLTVQIDASTPVNREAVALAVQGKFDTQVFPAVFSKARVAVRDADEPTNVSDAQLYPLQRHAKFDTEDDAEDADDRPKRRHKSHNLMDEDITSPPRYLTATLSQYRSGQVLIAGGKSVQSNLLLAYMYVRRLQQTLGPQAVHMRVYNHRVHNIVMCMDLGYPLNCDWIYQHAEREKLHDQITYEPEEFRGLTWKVTEDNILTAFVVFSSGKLHVTGLKDPRHKELATERAMRLIAPFRTGNEPAWFDPNHRRKRNANILNDINAELIAAEKYNGKVLKQRVTPVERSIRKDTQQLAVIMRQLHGQLTLQLKKEGKGEEEPNALLCAMEELAMEEAFEAMEEFKSNDEQESGIVWEI